MSNGHRFLDLACDGECHTKESVWEPGGAVEHATQNPDTPWDWHIHLHWGGFRDQCKHSGLGCVGHTETVELANCLGTIGT